MNNSKIFLVSTLGFFLSVFIGSFFKINLTISLFFAFLGFILIVLKYFKFFNNYKILLASLFFIFVSIGFLRIYTKDIYQKQNILNNFIDSEVTIEGLVVREVENRQSGQRILIDTEKIIFTGKEYLVDTKILISTSFYPKVSYGDQIKASGKLNFPENFITDVGKEFDYKNYLKKDGIFYILPFADVEVVSINNGNKFFSKILSIKESFLKSIENTIPAPESSLLSGLLLGVKGSLNEDLNQSFINTGLIHVVVLSGYNVTIIAEAIIKSLSFIAVKFSIYIGIFSIIVFAFMTGATATILRASIMAILALVARATGRNYEITRALILAAFIMVLHNPYILVFDISFQLSFLSTIGLIYLSPVFEKYFKFFTNKFSLREILAATFATQTFVLPFILYKIGNLSVIAPITNILVLPLIPVTMFFGFITGLLGLIDKIIALPFGFVAYFLLRLEIFIVELFAKIPFANIEITNFPLSLVIICYIFIFYFIHKNVKSSSQNAES